VRQGTVIIIPGRVAEQDCLCALLLGEAVPAVQNIGFRAATVGAGS
jgi:hypothetical protein